MNVCRSNVFTCMGKELNNISAALLPVVLLESSFKRSLMNKLVIFRASQRTKTLAVVCMPSYDIFHWLAPLVMEQPVVYKINFRVICYKTFLGVTITDYTSDPLTLSIVADHRCMYNHRYDPALSVSELIWVSCILREKKKCDEFSMRRTQRDRSIVDGNFLI